jgi:hypothetical protein
LGRSLANAFRKTTEEDSKDARRKGLTVAKPTHDEIIRELTREVATLQERLAAVRDRFDQRQTALQEQIQELKNDLKEARNRSWSLVPPVAGAIVSVLLGALVAYLVARLSVMP